MSKLKFAYGESSGCWYGKNVNGTWVCTLEIIDGEWHLVGNNVMLDAQELLEVLDKINELLNGEQQ